MESINLLFREIVFTKFLNRKHTINIFLIVLLFCLLPLALVHAQATLDVTFRYIEKPNDDFVRVFVPGTMPPGTSNDWGPNSNGFIDPNAPSKMTFDSTVDAYVRTYTLEIQESYEYKFHFHYNQSGTDWKWIRDPLNPNSTGGNFDNSVIIVSDPFFFEPARHENDNGLIDGLSVGIFTTGNVSNIKYVIGEDTLDGTAHLNADGVFYVPLSPRSMFERYLITATIDGQEYVAYDQPAIEITEKPRPENTNFGVNVGDQKATFVVYAPEQSVMQVLVGDPGETLLPSDAIVMNKATGEEDVWWIDVALSSGEYEYEYLLPDGRRISDSFSRRVRNGKTVFEMGPGGVSTADDYSWVSNDYVQPQLDTLIIYELHVDDFAAEGESQGRFHHIINKLDYLDSLGINAIELMPIMEFPGDRSWGYNTSHYAAVEATYGTPREFKQLIDEAHQRGIAVILDIVWNHMDSSGPLWQIQPDFALNPYFKRESDLRPRETPIGFGGVDMDHFTSQTQSFINKVHQIWVEEYRIDGFRFDFTRGIGWDQNQPNFGILGWSTALKTLDSTVYQIAEHLPADPYLIRISDLDAGWNDSFHDKLLNDIHGPKPILFTLQAMVLELHEYNTTNPGYTDRTQTVKATVTHDEQSLIQEMVRFKGLPLETALKRDLFYSTLTFTALGIPMIWQAQELGMQSGWYDEDQDGNWDEEKLAYRPMNWSLLETNRGKRHYQYYQKLMSLRKRNPALYRGKFYSLKRYDNERVLVYGYRDETINSQGHEVMVVANFSNQERIISEVPWLSSGAWTDVINKDSSLTVDADTVNHFAIPAYTAAVYAKDIETSVKGEIAENLPSDFRLKQNYPNPFQINNSKTIIPFQLPRDGHVELTIYNLLGQEIVKLVHQNYQAGTHQIVWQGRDKNGLPVPGGIYLYRLTYKGEQIYQKKLIIIR